MGMQNSIQALTFSEILYHSSMLPPPTHVAVCSPENCLFG